MKTKLLQFRNIIAGAMLISTAVMSAQTPWYITGNSGTNNTNYVGTKDNTPLYLRVNGSTANPGQALLTNSGSFVVESGNNTNIVNTKGSLVSGLNNKLGVNANSSLVSGWENDLTTAGGANIVAGQGNVVSNGAGKSVALGWGNTIKEANQFAIGVFVDLAAPYSGGFGVDLAATGDRSFVLGSGTGWGSKLTNNIPSSIMFGLTSTSTMLIKDQKVGVRTTNPTANFHTVGTVRLQDLPAGEENALVVDNDGNVMVAKKSYLHKTANNENIKNLQDQIDYLTQQVNELKELLLAKNNVVTDINTSINEAKLYQNTPNPAKGQTSIRYFLPNSAENASIEIYSATGQLIKSVSLKERGNGNINLTNYDFQTGTYFYKMIVDGRMIDSKTMLLQ